MIFATAYPDPAAVYCGVTGICGQMIVAVLCILSFALSFSRKTVGGSARVASCAFCLALVAAFLIMAAMQLDAKGMNSETVGIASAWAFLPSAPALVMVIWSQHQKARFNDPPNRGV